MFPRFRRSAFVVKGKTGAGKKVTDIKGLQYAFLDEQRLNTVEPIFPAVRRVHAAQGSPNTGQLGHDAYPPVFNNSGNVKHPFLSELISPTKIDRVWVSKPKKTSKNTVAYLGYDGVNPCYNISLECGKTYLMEVTLRGAGIQHVYGQLQMCETYEISTPCCTTCGPACDSKVSCDTFIDKALKSIGESKTIGRFIQANKVMKCCPTPAPFATFGCTEYCLTLCDEGDVASVQMQYPDKNVVIKKRTGVNTTYSFIQDSALAAPADFSKRDVVAPDCGVCGAGFTLNAGGDVYTVSIDNAGAGTTPAQWLAEVQAVLPTAVEAERIEFLYGTSIYTVTFPAGFVPPVVLPADTTISALVGTKDGYCVQTTPVTYPWTACGTYYKIKRSLCLTIMEPDCSVGGGGDLLDIQAQYASDPTIVPGSIALVRTDGCKSIYELEQYSRDCVQDGCDYVAESKFDRVISYKGHEWMMCKCEGWTVDVDGCPVPPPTATPPECYCGIRFEVGFVDTTTNGCCWDLAHKSITEPIDIQVTVRESTFVQSSIPSCSPLSIPFQVLQTGDFVSGSGQDVLRDVIRYRNYRYENFNNPTMKDACLYNKVEGLEYGVDVDAWYYAVHLTHTPENQSNAWNHDQHNAPEEIVWYVKDTDYLVLLELVKDVNKLTQSAKMGVPPLVV